jgi:hypothetical protein
MYLYATALEAAAPTVFMVWQRARPRANAKTLNKTVNNFFRVFYNILCINEHTVRRCVAPAAGTFVKHTREKENNEGR